MSKTYRCDCGDWSGEPCQWTGKAADMVVVEWMPNEHRASHTAAGNSGSYPDNGANRAAVERSCADLMVETDGEWVRIITEDVAAVEAAATADTRHCLNMWNDDDGEGDDTVGFDDRPSAEEIAEACREWAGGRGDGASIRVSWTLADAASEEIDSGVEDVAAAEAKPSHADN